MSEQQTTEARRAEILAEQRAQWPIRLEWAAQGDKLATVCLRCFRRHEPPRDSICPNPEPADA